MPMDTKKSESPVDWHPADVKAALEKRGVSLRSLAKRHGYSHIQRVLTSPWWAAEQIVARALELPAETIWPSRYGDVARRGQSMTRNESAIRLIKKTAKPSRAGGRT